MPKPKSLGEQLFEILEAEAMNRHHPDVPWKKLDSKSRKRYENVAATFAERIRVREFPK